MNLLSSVNSKWSPCAMGRGEQQSRIWSENCNLKGTVGSQTSFGGAVGAGPTVLYHIDTSTTSAISRETRKSERQVKLWGGNPLANSWYHTCGKATCSTMCTPTGEYTYVNMQNNIRSWATCGSCAGACTRSRHPEWFSRKALANFDFVGVFLYIYIYISLYPFPKLGSGA